MDDATENLEQALQRSFSLKSEVRRDAMKQITELPDEALLQLLASYSEPNRFASRRLARRLTRALPYSAFALTVAIAFSMDRSADPRLKGGVVFVGVCLVVLALWAFALTLALSNPHKSAARRQHHDSEIASAPCRIPHFSVVSLLVGRTDLRFLPFLLSGISADFKLFEREREGMDSSLPYTAYAGNSLGDFSMSSPRDFQQRRRRYRKVLKGMLAQIAPDEKCDFSAEERHGLLLLLQRPEEDVDFAVQLLGRLEQWGDAQTIPVLKRSIREKHWYVGSEQVETAARQCLEHIETRLRRQKQGDTLLRPAQRSGAEAPHSLLRPTAGQAENAPEQLLRPGSPLPPG